MILLERNKNLNLLHDLLQRITENKGYVCLISGEAGVGKTTLIENFLNQQDEKNRVLSGSCDALFTPRPLGPLYDIAEQLNNDLLKLLSNEASRNLIFSTFLNSLQSYSNTNIVIFEDVHWADESTLDLIKFLGRRVNRTNSLILITFRHDEINSEHPLRTVLGDIPSKDVIRCKLNPLSKETTNELAEAHGISNLFEITGGNPFLITELLNNEESGIPVSVKDSLITRISRLSAHSRELVQMVSIIPSYAEMWLLKELLLINDAMIDECIHSGLLKLENDHLSFKHELSRLAVEEALIPSQRHNLNEKVLNILLKKDDDGFLSRIIHHAEKTGNSNIFLKYAPRAAKHASKLGAHKLAASLYNNALKYSGDQPLDIKLELYEGRAFECYLTGQIEEGIAACENVIELLKDYADPYIEAENYRKLSRLTWYAGEDEKGEMYLRKSIEILEKLSPGRTLAMTYSNLSQTYMLRENTEPAIRWGETALNLAAQIKDYEVEVHALNNIGTAKMFAGDDSGKEYLQKSLDLSEHYNLHDHVSRAYDNFGAVYTSKRNLREAAKYYSKGIEYCGDKDLSTHELCMTGEMSKLKLYSGEWDEAVERANITLQKEHVPVIDRIIPLCILGLIRARRNDPGAFKLIKEADDLIKNAGELGKIVTVKAALAETFWLKNEIEKVIDDLDNIYNKVKAYKNMWAVGEIAYWLWKAGKEIPPFNGIALPYRLQISGEWKKAAKLWGEMRCPYDQALALSEGDAEAVKHAIIIFNGLGASAAVQLVKQKLRSEGVKNIPKGPRHTTRENPAGLTDRQMEIIALLKKGLTNNEIAGKLFISAKTVDHHVSAILSKLNIHSRVQAATLDLDAGKNRE